MSQSQRNGFLFNRTYLSRCQAGVFAQFHITSMSKHGSAFAEFVFGTNHNLVKFINQFLTAVHAFCRPTVSIADLWGYVTEGIAHGNGPTVTAASTTLTASSLPESLVMSTPL